MGVEPTPYGPTPLRPTPHALRTAPSADVPSCPTNRPLPSFPEPLNKPAKEQRQDTNQLHEDSDDDEDDDDDSDVEGSADQPLDF